MPFIRSISGLRATIGDGLSPHLIAAYTTAFANTVKGKKIVLGRDGRPSGKWVEDIVRGTLIACGCEVRLIGVAPTPTVQLEVEHSDASGGIVITASHNPGEWNGLKFINSDGVFLDEVENKKLWDLVDNLSFKLPDMKYFPDHLHDHDALHRHIKKIRRISSIANNLDSIKSKKFKVVVDAVNSSGSNIVPELLRSFDCEVIDLFCDGSGLFPHTPEPLPENLTDLAETVKAVRADIGIAVDPDADRLVLIDETGKAIGEEKTIALAVESTIMHSTHIGSIVVNLSTSSMSEMTAAKYGFKTFRAPVGEINVVKKMKEVGAVIGGEGSGGVILPECHYGRDSLVGIGLILNLMSIKNKKLSELSDDLPKLEMLKLKKKYTGSINELRDIIAKKYENHQITLLDGIRVDFADGTWFQLRTSNTEPIVRVIAESPTSGRAEQLANEIMNLI